MKNVNQSETNNLVKGALWAKYIFRTSCVASSSFTIKPRQKLCLAYMAGPRYRLGVNVTCTDRCQVTFLQAGSCIQDGFSIRGLITVTQTQYLENEMREQKWLSFYSWDFMSMVYSPNKKNKSLSSQVGEHIRVTIYRSGQVVTVWIFFSREGISFFHQVDQTSVNMCTKMIS